METKRAVEIEKVVEQVINTYNKHTADTPGELTVDVSRLATILGFLVKGMPMDSNDDGIIISTKKHKIIAINHERTLEEKRFIIAHELGHYYLDGGAKGALINYRERKHGRSDSENEKDYFAACLLMPAEVFKKVFAKVVEQADKSTTDYIRVCKVLAELFKVPYESAMRRMHELNLIETTESKCSN